MGMDEMLSAVVPVIVYWVFSGFYELLSRYCVNYRLHPKGEEEEKNTVPRSKVIKRMLTHHAIQIVTVCLVTKVWDQNEKGAAPKVQHSLPVIAVQFVIGMVVVDTVQYFMHRYMHENKFLYKHIHSYHHALVVPYACGAQYVSLLDGLFDTLGGVLAFLVSGMTVRTSIYFYSFTVLKGLDVHSGLYFPWINPLQAFFPNNSAFHDAHHQLQGQKYNFSQPFFVSWDKLLGSWNLQAIYCREEEGRRLSSSSSYQE